jgi:hypothetical protein
LQNNKLKKYIGKGKFYYFVIFMGILENITHLFTDAIGLQMKVLILGQKFSFFQGS